MEKLTGFSKLSKAEKIRQVAQWFPEKTHDITQQFESFWHEDPETQKLFDEFSENTLTNYYMPYGIVPNVLINNALYAVPMVIEESSVVAAAAKSAKFWMNRGGFKAEILGSTKIGQVHFHWSGNFDKLKRVFPELKAELMANTETITKNMRARGGGILNIELLDMTHIEPNYYQLKAEFETCDSMGANFINSCLESFAQTLEHWVGTHTLFQGQEKDILIIMSILSNYTPDCLVRAWVECEMDELGNFDGGMDAHLFAKKFKTAVNIARHDVHRATTHNKGIFNGIDAVVLATGNDFRAVEACGHAYASRDGQYRSLTNVSIKDGRFKFWLDIPIALGTVGGLTSLHPLAKRSLSILGNPSATELMQITAVIGLAQNFGALKSLVTTGIQKGHMKMHLLNILRHFQATDDEIQRAVEHFKTNIVSFSAVDELLNYWRNQEKKL